MEVLLMTNQELLRKMKKNMELRNFAKTTVDDYLRKTKEIIKYFNKKLEKETTDELREFLIKYLKDEKKLKDKSINTYNRISRLYIHLISVGSRRLDT